MSTLAENIKKYRKLNKFTQKSLASALGIAPTAVSAWELGRNKPLMDNVEHMALLFNIRKSELLGDDFLQSATSQPILEHSPGNKNSAPNHVTDKVVYLDQELKEPRHSAWINHGERLLEEQETVEYSTDAVSKQIVTYYTYNYYDQPASAGTGQYLNDVQVEQIELPTKVNADFVVPIYGDSMEPEYQSGDYVFVKLSVNLSDGDIGVFEYYGDAYIKQLLISKEGAFLHSLNSKYKDIPVDADSDFRIIGKVVDVYREK